jgi:hypothetical protein
LGYLDMNGDLRIFHKGEQWDILSSSYVVDDHHRRILRRVICPRVSSLVGLVVKSIVRGRPVSWYLGY